MPSPLPWRGTGHDVTRPKGERHRRRKSWPRWISHLGAIARPKASLRHAAAEDAFRENTAPLHPGAGEGRDPGDLTTIEDPAALEQIRHALTSRPDVRH